MKLGIIGGTGLGDLALGDVRSLTIDTPWGQPSGPLRQGRLGVADVVFVNRHGPGHELPPHAVNYRANIAAMHGEGVEAIVAVNAVGGITPAMAPGSLVLPHQLIDYTWGRGHTYSDSAGQPLQHVDFTEPYSEALRQALLAAAGEVDLHPHVRAVQGISQGPRLETAAEIERMERDGCDLVGMTGMPEAALARELDVPYACIAVVVNPAAGKGDNAITMADISAVMAGATPVIISLIEVFCQRPRLRRPDAGS